MKHDEVRSTLDQTVRETRRLDAGYKIYVKDIGTNIPVHRYKDTSYRTRHKEDYKVRTTITRREKGGKR